MNLNSLKLATVFVAIAIGVASGIGVFTFGYAKGYSYLSNDPQACANCHIMNEQYDGWVKSSHRNVATCNDCHTPANPVGKYMTKASNGFWHSYYFTFNNFHEPIQITPKSKKITEASCMKCHADLTRSINGHSTNTQGSMSCVRCHNSVGHLD